MPKHFAKYTLTPRKSMNLSGQFPLVPILCDAPDAGWFGKWHFNVSPEWTVSVGGPFETAEEAVNAALKTGLYRIRDGAASVQLDRI